MLFALLSLSSCLKVDESYKHPEYMNLLREIEYETIQELKKKGLYISGFGGCLMDCIRLVDLSFRYEKYADISKARELIVLVVETFLKKINNHEKIRPDLCNYPFSSDNLDIQIDLIGNDKIIKKKKMEIVNFVVLKEGMIFYKYSGINNSIYKNLEKETYKEAKEKAKLSSKLSK